MNIVEQKAIEAAKELLIPNLTYCPHLTCNCCLMKIEVGVNVEKASHSYFIMCLQCIYNATNILESYNKENNPIYIETEMRYTHRTVDDLGDVGV